jgi:hypothetical protein
VAFPDTAYTRFAQISAAGVRLLVVALTGAAPTSRTAMTEKSTSLAADPMCPGDVGPASKRDQRLPTRAEDQPGGLAGEYTPDKPSPILRALKRYEPGKTSLHRVKLSPNTSPLTIGRNLGEKWSRPPADGLYMPRDRSGGQNSVPASRLSLADGRSRRDRRGRGAAENWWPTT